LTDVATDADVAFLYHEDSKYALEFMPPLNKPDTNIMDKNSYVRIFDTMYRPFFDLSAQTAIVHPNQAFEKYPLLVVPALYAADNALLERLQSYAENGGHLLITFRSGYGDEFARARWERGPGPLRTAVGASYTEYSNLFYPIAVSSDKLTLHTDAMATAWTDGLELEGAESLVEYVHPHFGRYPAITTQVFGKGRVTYCGTLPNPSLGKTLAKYVLAQANVQLPFEDLPPTVRVITGKATSGKKLFFFTNWSWDTVQLPAIPGGGTELFSHQPLANNDRLSIGSWDVKIVVQG
ncbi:MAG: beta-galactosidase trimerization domain-containing protein, partial [Anaerolineae bacterium]|nr:beta-galactosidase trimerization domain-containing protein [Anaerolineae bacterium]